MQCPHCDVHVDEHEASPCFNLWIIQDVLKWKKEKSPYKGDYYPEGSYFISWYPQDDHPCTYGISQAFDKDGNNLRVEEDNPLGIWDENPNRNYSLYFSTDISAAWDLVEKFRKEKILLPIWSLAVIGDMPLAICREAIKIVHAR